MTEDAMEEAKAMEDPPEITERCVATARTTGERCKNSAIDGGNVCRFHGGATEHIQESAQERLKEIRKQLLGRVSPKLLDLFDQYETAETVDERVRVMREIRQWTTDVLDRTGEGPTETREHTGEDGGPLMILETDGSDE